MRPKNGQALGLIETSGYSPLIAAVDGAIKAANVTLVTRNLVGGGLVVAIVCGEVGSVSAALSAAGAVIDNLGAWGKTHIIARPDPAIWEMLRKEGFIIDDPDPDPGHGFQSEEADTPASANSTSNRKTGTPAQTPVTKGEVTVPTIRAEAAVPAVRAKAAVPAVRAKAAVPMIVNTPKITDQNAELQPYNKKKKAKKRIIKKASVASEKNNPKTSDKK